MTALLQFLRRRLEGDHAVDDFGFDADLNDNVILPLLRPTGSTPRAVADHGGAPKGRDPTRPAEMSDR